MEESLIKYRNLLEVAEGRAPSQLAPRAESKSAGGLAGPAAKSAPVPPPPAKQVSLSSGSGSSSTLGSAAYTVSLPAC